MLNFTITKITACVGIVIIALSTFSGCNLQGQSIQTFPLRRSYDYPINKGLIIPILNVHPGNVTAVPDSLHDLFKHYQYIKLSAENLLPTDPYLTSFYKQDKNLDVHAVLFRLLDNNKAVLILDADADEDFAEEKVDTLNINTSALLMKQFVMNDAGQPCPFILPLIFKINYKEGVFRKMEIQNLLKYELRYPLGHDTLAIDIQAHYYRMWCRYRDPDRYADSLLAFQMNEPFRFKGNWYKLSNLDLCGNTVQLEQLDGDKIMGFQDGQYLDISMIKQLTEKNMASDVKVDWGKKPYFLLHFWGVWCQPCIAEMPEVKALDERLKTSSNVQMIHYPWIFKKEDQNLTVRYIQENGLSSRQSYCIANDYCSSKDKEQCNMASFARVVTFPQYILIDQQGKIIYRNKESGVNAVNLQLQKLGLN